MLMVMWAGLVHMQNNLSECFVDALKCQRFAIEGP